MVTAKHREITDSLQTSALTTRDLKTMWQFKLFLFWQVYATTRDTASESLIWHVKMIIDTQCSTN